MSSIQPNLPAMTGMASTTTLPGASGVGAARTGATLLDASLHAPREDGGRHIPASELPAPRLPAGDSHASAAEALRSLSSSTVSSDMYAVMALFQELAQEQRNAARQDRQASVEAQIHAMNTAAEQIRQAAETRFLGAIVAGAVSIAAGAVHGPLAAAAQPRSADAGARLGAQAPALTPIGGISQGASAVPGHIGAIVGTGQTPHAVERAQDGVGQTGTQQADELMQNMMDVIRDVRDKLASIEQSRLETNRGIARNI